MPFAHHRPARIEIAAMKQAGARRRRLARMLWLLPMPEADLVEVPVLVQDARSPSRRDPRDLDALLAAGYL